MPSSKLVDRPEPVLTIVNKYLRRERPISIFVALVAAGIAVSAYFAMSLLPAVGIAAVSVGALRVPLIRPRGRARLRTDNTPEAVTNAFTGPLPPILPFQWGVADEVDPEGDVPAYRVSYLLGLQSIEITLHTQTTTLSDGSRRIELTLWVNEQPWSTYVVDIFHTDGQTLIEYEYEADCYFGLRRIPQRRIADRYFERALDAQGYEVLERHSEFDLRGIL